MISLLVMVGVASAARPDSGASLYAYDPSDIIEYVDGPDGRVRVHYSVDGPNVTLLSDDDGSGYPDFAEMVAASAEDVLLFYSALGFRTPLTEAEMGLSDLGGSEAFDFYLVDFAGTADGLFSQDRCSAGVCAGHMVIENDFRGYGYASLDEAVRVLTSHELFHAVQAAYNSAQPVWMSEGTAVWAEFQYDPGVPDFFWFSDEYLTDTSRALDRPPAGSVTSFSYGTAIFFQFLTERLGEGIGPAIQDEMVGLDEDDAVSAIVAAIDGEGSDLPSEWARFAVWNVATGNHSGLAESYPFADELNAVRAEVEGTSIHDDNRFYPLAATYFRLNDHPGGPLYFAHLDDATGIRFSLHAVEGDYYDGPVYDAALEWSVGGAAQIELGDFDPGYYWLVGTYPEVAADSVKLEFCLGDADAVAECAAPESDTGTPDTGDATGDGGADDTGQAQINPLPEDDGGCGCASAAGGGSAAWISVLGLVAVGRRRRR